MSDDNYRLCGDYIECSRCGIYYEIGVDHQCYTVDAAMAISYMDGYRDGCEKLTADRDRWKEQVVSIISVMYDMDCGAKSCIFAKTKTGVRISGGCRCLAYIDGELRRELVKIWRHNQEMEERDENKSA